MKSQIIIEVEPEIARRFETASPATREAIVRQLYETLSREREDSDAVGTALSEANAEMRRNGMTDEIAQELLDEILKTL